MSISRERYTGWRNDFTVDELKHLLAAKSVRQRLKVLVRIVKARGGRPSNGSLGTQVKRPNLHSQAIQGNSAIRYSFHLDEERSILMYEPSNADNLKRKKTKSRCKYVNLYGTSRAKPRL